MTLDTHTPETTTAAATRPWFTDASIWFIVTGIVALLGMVSVLNRWVFTDDTPDPVVTLAEVAARCDVVQDEPGRIVLDRHRESLDGNRLTYTENYACVLQALGAGDLYGTMLTTAAGSRVVGPFFLDWHVGRSNWHVLTVSIATEAV